MLTRSVLEMEPGTCATVSSSMVLRSMSGQWLFAIIILVDSHIYRRRRISGQHNIHVCTYMCTYPCRDLYRGGTQIIPSGFLPRILPFSKMCKKVCTSSSHTHPQLSLPLLLPLPPGQTSCVKPWYVCSYVHVLLYISFITL